MQVFLESERRYSPFLTEFCLNASDDEPPLGITALNIVSISEEKQEAVDVNSLLCYLRFELVRARPGMGDFIIRVASPKIGDKNTVVSIRGNRQMGKVSEVEKVCKVIQLEMSKRNDASFKWIALDKDKLAAMLVATFKFFTTNLNAETIQFSTDALSEEAEK